MNQAKHELINDKLETAVVKGKDRKITSWRWNDGKGIFRSCCHLLR